MAQEDGERWDARYDGHEVPAPGPPTAFAGHIGHFPSQGSALEIACGLGAAASWLAQRGLRVEAYDVSSTAVAIARQVAIAAGVADKCQIEVADFDNGVPPGGEVDVVLCHLFRDERLDAELLQRLRPGGVLAIAVLSEVGAEPGQFRAVAGELGRRFGALDVIAEHEADGVAWLLARQPE